MITHQHDETPMQEVQVLVRLTFEAPISEPWEDTEARMVTYVIGGCQVFADSLTAPVEIAEVIPEAAIYRLGGIQAEGDPVPNLTPIPPIEVLTFERSQYECYFEACERANRAPLPFDEWKGVYHDRY